jgi:hypothetical protein
MDHWEMKAKRKQRERKEITAHVTYLPPWSRVLLQKPIAAQLVKEFPALCNPKDNYLAWK